MISRNTSLSLLALAGALALSSSLALQAAPRLGPGTTVQTDTIIQQIQARADDPEDPNGRPAKKGAKKKGAEKKAKQDGPAKKAAAKAGRCGTYMYWDKKAKRCADARNKK
jgi:hypothetical protein